MGESCFHIRSAILEDLAQLADVQSAATQLVPESKLPVHLRYGVTDPDTLRTACRDRRIWVAIAEDGWVVGFAMADIVDGEAHLDELNVRPEFGRRGIGTALVDTVRAWATDKGFGALTLVTFRQLPWNEKFYEKQGFSELPDRELGAGIARLIDEEAKVGINTKDRVAMQVTLSSGDVRA